MKDMLKVLEEKRAVIGRELDEAAYAATQVKTWAAIANQRAVNVLNHIRDAKQLQDKADALIEEIGVAYGTQKT
jgi:F0F1-type ATP synthase membrane subunit b/b'